jgi:hypothetical protein
VESPCSRRCVDDVFRGFWMSPGSGGAIFLKSSTIGNNRSPYAIVRSDRAYRHLVGPPCSRRGVYDVFWGFWMSPGSGGTIFLKISTIGNNRWPYAIVRSDRAYRHLVGPPCSRRRVDDVFWGFWRSPGTPGVFFSQNLNYMEQPLALCNHPFK